MSDPAGPPLPASRYRPEIDGLRAIAVVAVILFHAGFAGLPGGFLGVDIFFVISGYLITGIIQGDLERGRFSILAFYERRMRRILPALLVMMLLSVPVAALIMIPSDLRSFGGSLVATTLSANNVLLYLGTNYFDTASAFKPLTHSWSLGVEEQYYLVVPLLLAGVWRLGGKRAVWAVIATLSVASFIACLILSWFDPLANFYLIWSRVWELGAGAAVALAEPRARWRLPGLPLVGLAMIVASMLLIGEAGRLPGWPTLVPVAGTCLLLGFANPGDPVTRLLSARPFVAIGLISYSAYLYHQPLFAFARLASVDRPGWPVFAGLIVLTFLLAWLSWGLVERPFRDRARMPTRHALAFVAAGAALTLAIGLIMVRAQGFAAWSPTLQRDKGFDVQANALYVNRALRYRTVILPETGANRLLVIGDSFGRDFINAGLDSGNFDGVTLSYGARPLCGRLDRDSGNLYRNTGNADRIVLAYSISLTNLRCVERLANAIRAHSTAPMVIVGTKNFGANPKAAALAPADLRARPEEEAREANRQARERLRAFGYIDTLALISDARGKVPLFTPTGRLISADGGHLTPAGAAWLGAIWFAQPGLREITRPKAAHFAAP
jgi:peptidoglycan/LPS O-acetylase OafA/YrhL